MVGAHSHRLNPDLEVPVTARLPRDRPYNSFVILPDGCLVTKDSGGVLPGQDPTAHQPEPSIARLSADGDAVYVVGTRRRFRARWDGRTLVEDATGVPSAERSGIWCPLWARSTASIVVLGVVAGVDARIGHRSPNRGAHAGPLAGSVVPWPTIGAAGRPDSLTISRVRSTTGQPLTGDRAAPAGAPDTFGRDRR